MTLVAYESDDDDVVQVDYKKINLTRKRSRDEHEGDESFRQKAISAPSLPSSFRSLYASNVRTGTSDDPALHAGRQRQVPHTVGNWPSFVYLEWLPCDEDLAILDRVIANANDRLDNAENTASNPSLQSSLRSELGVRLPLHISLSAPLILTTENKDNFEQDLVSSVTNAGVSAFKVVPKGIRWVHNYDGSRYFLILTLERSHGNELQRLLHACNKIAKQYNLTELYSEGNSSSVGVPVTAASKEAMPQMTTVLEKEDRFHISIAWTLQRLDTACGPETASAGGTDVLQIIFNKVLLKIGNNISSIPLHSAGDKVVGEFGRRVGISSPNVK